MLHDAGAREVSEETFVFHARSTLRTEQFWNFQCELSDTLRGKVAELEAKQVAAIANQVEAAIQPYFTGGAMDMPVKTRLVVGYK